MLFPINPLPPASSTNAAASWVSNLIRAVWEHFLPRPPRALPLFSHSSRINGWKLVALEDKWSGIISQRTMAHKSHLHWLQSGKTLSLRRIALKFTFWWTVFFHCDWNLLFRVSPNQSCDILISKKKKKIIRLMSLKEAVYWFVALNAHVGVFLCVFFFCVWWFLF